MVGKDAPRTGLPRVFAGMLDPFIPGDFDKRDNRRLIDLQDPKSFELSKVQSNLLKKIAESTVEKIYITLDTDAMKQALKHCEYLLNQGKEVYLVELEGKDPSEIGFYYFTKLIQNTLPLDSYSLMEKKFSLI